MSRSLLVDDVVVQSRYTDFVDVDGWTVDEWPD